MVKYNKKFEKKILPFILKSKGLENGIDIDEIYSAVYGNKIDKAQAFRDYIHTRVRHLIQSMEKDYPQLAIKNNKVFIPKNPGEVKTKMNEYHKHINTRGINATRFVIASSNKMPTMAQNEVRETMRVSLVLMANRLKKLAGDTDEEK